MAVGRSISLLMDPVADIKARLPIDQLMAQYAQLQKKGRNFVCLCPFHNDTRPSFLVSPDKGIAYCFACNSGGDIFSVYQKLEGVDFPQALKELAEKTGVTLPDRHEPSVPKDEKERLRACLEASVNYFRSALSSSDATKDYVRKRGVSAEQAAAFELGFAPDARSALYDHLLKVGFSRTEVVNAGMAIQRDLTDTAPIDRFRNRLVFPIRDLQGRVIGFGGRTLGNDDAKYLNSAETSLYHKSNVLYGIHQAKESIRESKRVVLVEGYFDVLACHRVGVPETVAACGTALTDEHARMIKRYADTVVLCLDQDSAGRRAADKAFVTLSRQGLAVQGAVTGAKDAADTAQESPEALTAALTTGVRPYIDIVLGEFRQTDTASASGKRAAIERVLPLLDALPTSVERAHYSAATAAALGTSESAVEDDLRRYSTQQHSALPRAAVPQARTAISPPLFSAAEIALGFFLSVPRLLHLLPELIPPEDGMPAALYIALTAVDASKPFSIDELAIPDEHRQAVQVLALFCEQHGFTDLSENLAVREIRKNCKQANRAFLQKKMQDIARQLRSAGTEGRDADRALLQQEFEQLQKLSKLAQ